MTSNANRTRVKSVETLLDVVAFLHDRREGTIEEVADGVGVGTSTAHRHLVTLRERGYVVADSGTYRLSFKFLTHGGAARRRLPARELIARKIRKISEDTGERAQFLVEEHGERVYVYTDAGQDAVKMDATIGKRGPLHVSAAGKAILANLPAERRDEILSDVTISPRTDNTITDREALEAGLAEVRQRGYAFNDEESTTGLRAVGVPIFSDGETVLGAISVSGPANRLKGSYFQRELPDLLLGTVNEIELELKYA